MSRMPAALHPCAEFRVQGPQADRYCPNQEELEFLRHAVLSSISHGVTVDVVDEEIISINRASSWEFASTEDGGIRASRVFRINTTSQSLMPVAFHIHFPAGSFAPDTATIDSPGAFRPDWHRAALLHAWAAHFEHPSIVVHPPLLRSIRESLLHHHADLGVNMRQFWLLHACLANSPPDVVQFMLDEVGCAPSIESSLLHSCLYARAIESQEPASVIRLLMERGFDIEERDENGRTALMNAACDARPQALLALLEAGARTDGSDLDGKTIIDLLQEGVFFDESQGEQTRAVYQSWQARAEARAVLDDLGARTDPDGVRP